MNASQRRVSREEAAAIKAEVDYQRLNKSFTDVTFIVGPAQHSKKYVGHRVLLAMTSPVFETMFYGDMADKSKCIRIVDIAPIGFENLLRYAYTDTLKLGSVEDAMLTAYAAKKYLLPQLLRETLTYIEHNISPATACLVFEFAHVLNSQQLVLQAMNLIDRQTVQVVQSKSFGQAQASTVEFVANRRYLTLESELQLWLALVEWARAEARRQQLDASNWRLVRTILEEANCLAAIRFLAMSAGEFARAILRTSARATGASVEHDDDQQQQHQDDPQQQQQDGHNSSEPPRRQRAKSLLDASSPNSLLDHVEQRAILINLALAEPAAQLPANLCARAHKRPAPPEYFTLQRFKQSATQLVSSTTSTRQLSKISTKFQCLSENLFIVGLTIPLRLDAASFANRTPKFECHLKFTTRANMAAPAAAADLQQDDAMAPAGTRAPAAAPAAAAAATLMMDTIDESLHISIARDKDCLVRFKRPILIRMGNVNELALTFQTYALDEDIVLLRTPKVRSANFSELTDSENISWLFFKSSGIEFSELHYYY